MAFLQLIDTWIEDEFTPTGGQVTFILSAAPNDPPSFTMRVNGVAYDDPTHYSISGVNVTWTNVAFVMATDDLVQCRYQ